jgi:1-acyl-sn-glycerol-3-phosphate acyltransferase
MYLAGTLGRPAGTSFAHKARLVTALAADKARAAARALPGLLFAGYVVVLGLLVIAPLWLLVLLSRSPRFALACGRWSVRMLLRGAFCRLSVEGLGNLPAKGPCLLVANHASYVDVPVLMALLPTDFRFVSKIEALRYPIIGTYLRRCGHLTVDRFDVQQSLAGASEVARAMEAGLQVLLFPEGTFTEVDGLRPFRMGAFKTAVDTGAPVVPMALRGTRRVLRGETLRPRPGPIHLWIGEPIVAEGSDWRAMVALRDRAAAQIAAHTGEPLLDLVAGGPERPPSPPE